MKIVGEMQAVIDIIDNQHRKVGELPHVPGQPGQVQISKRPQPAQATFDRCVFYGVMQSIIQPSSNTGYLLVDHFVMADFLRAGLNVGYQGSKRKKTWESRQQNGTTCKDR